MNDFCRGFFFHLQGLISRSPDCNSAVLENMLDCIETCAFYGVVSYASFDDIAKLLKNPAALPQTAPAHAHCFGYRNPFCCRPESCTFDFFIPFLQQFYFLICHYRNLHDLYYNLG